MEVTRMAAWAVVSLCAVAAVYGFVKVVVACLRAFGEDDGWFDDADEEPEEADDARGA